MAYKEPKDPLTGKGKRHSDSAKKEEKISTSIISSKADIEYARTLGENAFKSGKPEIPNEDDYIIELIEDMHFREATPYLKAWIEGWENMEDLKKSNVEIFKFKLDDGEKITAKKSLNTSILYHGTDIKFETFKGEFLGGTHGTSPFTDNIDVARTFGKYIIEVKVDIKNPYIINAEGKDYSEFKHVLNEILEKTNRKEYDGIIIRNYKNAGIYGEPMLSNHFIPFKDSQIKVIRTFLYLK